MDTMMPQSTPFYFYNVESEHQQQMGAMLPQAYGLPATPVYSRPGSSSCSQPPTLFSNGPSTMTPSGSPPLTHIKPSIMLETDFSDSYFPATPPLSTAGSSVGSPKSFDALQTPMNPMFSGLDGFDGSNKEIFESAEISALDWSSCGSPPMTPVYIQSQASKAPSFSTTASLLSTASCPSLSPSPAPFARSLSASELLVDFCDPRHLTVASGVATSNPTLAPECDLTTLGEEELKIAQPKAALSQPSFDFNAAIPDGLPSFEDYADLESEDDFVNSLVNLGDSIASDVGRPRACTGSSVVSLGHGSFIGDEDLSFEENDSFQFPSLPTPVSMTEDTHKDKRHKKSHQQDERVVTSIMSAATSEAQTADNQQDAATPEDDAGEESDSNGSSGSEGSPAPLPAPANRRGRKQSLTEDPSKTFVCDLCSRRFRRQEHLKRHYRSLHTHDKPFECNECGKKFSRSDNLAQHARTHAGGAIVMNLIEDGTVGYDTGLPAPSADDFSTYGKVLFQIASEVPGSASEPSSDEDKDEGKKKRKRSD